MSCALDLFSTQELLKRKEYHVKKIKEIDELLKQKDEELKQKDEELKQKDEELKQKDEELPPKLIENNSLQKNVKIKIKIISKNTLI